MMRPKLIMLIEVLAFLVVVTDSFHVGSTHTQKSDVRTSNSCSSWRSHPGQRNLQRQQEERPLVLSVALYKDEPEMKSVLSRLLELQGSISSPSSHTTTPATTSVGPTTDASPASTITEQVSPSPTIDTSIESFVGPETTPPIRPEMASSTSTDSMTVPLSPLTGTEGSPWTGTEGSPWTGTEGSPSTGTEDAATTSRSLLDTLLSKPLAETATSADLTTYTTPTLNDPVGPVTPTSPADAAALVDNLINDNNDIPRAATRVIDRIQESIAGRASGRPEKIQSAIDTMAGPLKQIDTWLDQVVVDSPRQPGQAPLLIDYIQWEDKVDRLAKYWKGFKETQLDALIERIQAERAQRLQELGLEGPPLPSLPAIPNLDNIINFFQDCMDSFLKQIETEQMFEGLQYFDLAASIQAALKEEEQHAEQAVTAYLDTIQQAARESAQFVEKVADIVERTIVRLTTTPGEWINGLAQLLAAIQERIDGGMLSSNNGIGFDGPFLAGGIAVVVTAAATAAAVRGAIEANARKEDIAALEQQMEANQKMQEAIRQLSDTTGEISQELVDLRATLAAKDYEVAQLKSDIRELTNRIEASEATERMLRAELKAKDDTISEQALLLDKLQAENAKLKSELAKLEAEAAKAKYDVSVTGLSSSSINGSYAEGTLTGAKGSKSGNRIKPASANNSRKKDESVADILSSLFFVSTDKDD